MRLCVFICSFYAKNALCSYEFEDSFDVCGKYGNGSLHLHGVKAVRLGSVISKNKMPRGQAPAISTLPYP
jgi:hypothetical protein